MKLFVLGLIAIIMTISTPAFAGSKLWKGNEAVTLRYRVDLSASGAGAVGAHTVATLPTGFIVSEVILNTVTPLTGGGSIVLGEAGTSTPDADGYCLDFDAAAAATPIKCAGALLHTAPATPNEIGNEKPHKVSAANDGLAYTIASTLYSVGVFEILVIGYQGE